MPIDKVFSSVFAHHDESAAWIYVQSDNDKHNKEAPATPNFTLIIAVNSNLNNYVVNEGSNTLEIWKNYSLR